MKELTNSFVFSLYFDKRIKWIFVTEDKTAKRYELRIRMQDDFVITLFLDMYDFEEEQVISELREMIEQVYGGIENG